MRTRAREQESSLSLDQRDEVAAARNKRGFAYKYLCWNASRFVILFPADYCAQFTTCRFPMRSNTTF